MFLPASQEAGRRGHRGITCPRRRASAHRTFNSTAFRMPIMTALAVFPGRVPSSEIAGLVGERREGTSAPASQKNGKKNPKINITQCPFLIDMAPRVTTSLGRTVPVASTSRCDPYILRPLYIRCRHK
jgi:hypothetical protein